MANSKIRIEFLVTPDINEFLSFSESNLGLSIIETFRPSRLASKQVKLPALINGSISGTDYDSVLATNYFTAFWFDYNSSNLFSIQWFPGSGSTSHLGSVEITANYPNAFFTLIETPPATNVVITNGSAVTPITIDNVLFSAAPTPNTHARVNITTSVLATKLNTPVVINPNTSNPFYVDVLRGSTNIFEVENSEGSKTSMSVTAPKVLDSNNFNLVVTSSPNGGTVTISEKEVSGLDLQYSLDNIDYKVENVFSGLFPDDYTLYIKDSIGGTVQIPFNISDFGIYTPYFYISKSNSIRFANRINWGDAANYKNDENTLGAEVDVQLAYSGCQNFKSANVITTQFKSNYQSNLVKVIRADATEVNIPVVKKSSNIGIKSKMDAFKFSLGNGKTGIYFLTGNVYNFDTNTVISSHFLSGNLPEWAFEGNYIIIDNAWYLIEDVFYDENKSADVVIISNNYTDSEVSVVVGSIYNDFNYEIYEFTIDMVDYLNSTIQVKITNTDAYFETVTHLSEKLDVAINFPKNVEIYYWNDDNTDVFYATGIRHLINVELTKQEGATEEESKVHKTDTTALLLIAQLYELKKFIFEPVSEEIWRKIMIALSHKNVFINGVQYVKSGDFETEGPLGKSNLYVLTATMLKTGIVYNADSADGADFNTGSIEIPGLIQTEIGFVKY